MKLSQRKNKGACIERVFSAILKCVMQRDSRLVATATLLLGGNIGFWLRGGAFVPIGSFCPCEEVFPRNVSTASRIAFDDQNLRRPNRVASGSADVALAPSHSSKSGVISSDRRSEETQNLDGIARSTSRFKSHSSSSDQSQIETRSEGERIRSTCKIPHNIFYTYKDDILKTKAPPLIYWNLMNTTHAYRTLWDEPNATVYMLTDEDCRVLVNGTEPRLVAHFDAEQKGMYKADICRVAALFEKGGYYFDIDMKVIQPIHLDADVSFSTVQEYVGSRKKKPANETANFFQSFLASEPRSEILRRALDYMLGHYNGTRSIGADYVGTRTLKDAFYDTSPEVRGRTKLLEEVRLGKSDLYPSLERPKGRGLCDFVVHDPEEKEAYFYSRGVGMGKFCRLE